MHTLEQWREPRAKPTKHHQVTLLRESVLDKINRIEMELQDEWESNPLLESEDYPHNFQ